METAAEGRGFLLYNEGLITLIGHFIINWPYISAARYYSGQKAIDGKKVNNTGAKDMGARIDNLEYKKTK